MSLAREVGKVIEGRRFYSYFLVMELVLRERYAITALNVFVIYGAPPPGTLENYYE